MHKAAVSAGREQPCLKRCFRNVPSLPGTPALPSSPQGCLPPSLPPALPDGLPAPWLSTLCAGLQLCSPTWRSKLGVEGAVGSHIKPTACPRALGASKVAIPRGVQGRPQQPALTSAPLPGWDWAAHVSPGTRGSSPVNYVRLRCHGRDRRARGRQAGRQAGSWSISPSRCPLHPSSRPGSTAQAHQQHLVAGLLSFRGDLWQL